MGAQLVSRLESTTSHLQLYQVEILQKITKKLALILMILKEARKAKNIKRSRQMYQGTQNKQTKDMFNLSKNFNVEFSFSKLLSYPLLQKLLFFKMSKSQL